MCGCTKVELVARYPSRSLGHMMQQDATERHVSIVAGPGLARSCLVAVAVGTLARERSITDLLPLTNHLLTRRRGDVANLRSSSGRRPPPAPLSRDESRPRGRLSHMSQPAPLPDVRFTPILAPLALMSRKHGRGGVPSPTNPTASNVVEA